MTTREINTNGVPFIGRQHYLERFMPIREQVLAGKSAVVGIAGAPGAGKTLLMRRFGEIMGSPVSGYGKYDAVRTLPYEGVAYALDGVVAAMTSAPSYEDWKLDVANSLGEGATALVGLTPALADVLRAAGVDPQSPSEASLDSEAVLLAVLQGVTTLVASVARHVETLTLMLDDLQWAGNNTMALIRRLAEASIPGMLIVTARRSQVDGRDAQRYESLFHEEFDLESMNRDELSKLFGAISGKPPSERVLSALERLTKGNAQLAAELLRSDIEQGRLTWDDETKAWIWDRTEEPSGLIGGLEKLLADRLDRLPPADSELIAVAAALGTTFTADDLASAGIATREEVDTLLASPAARGFLTTTEDSLGDTQSQYRFAHDRLAEIAARRLSPSQYKEVNVRLGEKLVRSGEDRLSDALVHLSAGIDLIEDEGLRYQITQLAALEGDRARGRAAFSIALGHFRTGLQIMPDPDSDPGLNSKLIVGAVEAAWLSGDEELSVLLKRAQASNTTLVDRARLATIEMKLGLAGHGGLNPTTALETGLSTLHELGIDLPAKPGTAGVLTALLRTRRRLAEHDLEALSAGPPSDDVEAIWAEQVLGEMFSTAYAIKPALFPYVVIEAVNLTLDKGRLPMTPVALAGFGLLLVVVADSPLLERTRPRLVTSFYKDALRYGDLAVRLAESRESVRYRPWSQFLYYDFINHWRDPIRSQLQPIRSARKEALEVGDPAYGAYLADVELADMFALGFSCAEIDARGRAMLEEMGQGQEKQYELIEHLVQSAELFAGKTDGQPYVISGSTGYDENEILSREDDDAVSLSVLWNMKLTLAVLGGAYEKTAEFADETARHLSGLAGTTYVPFHHMMNSFGRVMVDPEGRATKSALKTALRKYRRWQELSPSNYLATYQLLEGLAAQVAGDRQSALNRLEDAARSGRSDRLPIVEALAHIAAAGIVEDATSREDHALAAAEIWATMGNAIGLESLTAQFPEFPSVSAIAPKPEAIPGGADVSATSTSAVEWFAGQDLGGLRPGEETTLELTAIAFTTAVFESAANTATAAEIEVMRADTRTIVQKAVDRRSAWLAPNMDLALFGSVSDAVDAAQEVIEEHTARNRRAQSGGGQPIGIHIGLSSGVARLIVGATGEPAVSGELLDSALALSDRSKQAGSTLTADAQSAGQIEDAGRGLQRRDGPTDDVAHFFLSENS